VPIPLEQHEDVEKGLRDKWETELAAAIEAEYRRRRAELLMLIHWWLRDAWIQTLGIGQELLKFPQITGRRRSPGASPPGRRWKTSKPWSKPSVCFIRMFKKPWLWRSLVEVAFLSPAGNHFVHEAGAKIQCPERLRTGLWALLGLAIIKFGNPVILDQKIPPPASVNEFILEFWPSIGPFGFGCHWLCWGSADL